MKRLVCWVLMAVMLLTALPAMADNARTSGDFTYIVSESGNITITGIDNEKCDSNLIVPDVLDGYTVTAIGDKAFMNAPITTINIPASIESIGAGAFANCPLNQFIVSPENETFTTIDGVLYNKTTKTLVSFPMEKDVSGEITIPDGIVAIGDYAFYIEPVPNHDVDGRTGTPYKRNKVERFDKRYTSKHRIYSIEWPSTLRSIGDYAFYGRDFQSEYVGATASSPYDHNYFLIPASVESIGAYAFSYCRFTLPEESAISNSYTITLAKGLNTIGIGCFKDAVIDNDDASATYTVSLGSNITEIADYAFCGFSAVSLYEGTDIMTIKLPESAKNIGSSAFENSIPVKGFDKLYPATIGRNAFANTGFYETEITIRNSTQVISTCAFAGLKSGSEYDILYSNNEQMPVKIILEEGIEAIDAEAFAGQLMLSEVHICSTLTEIGTGAFSGCKKLTSIAIPSSVTSIGENAFEKGIITIYVQAGSYAEKWCNENGYSYSIEGQNSLDWLNN